METTQKNFDPNLTGNYIVRSNIPVDINLNEPADLMLDERGMISDCNNACEKLFGYPRADLVWQHISKLFPQLSDIKLMNSGRINSRLSYLSRCDQVFQTKNQRGEIFNCSLHFIPLNRSGKQVVRLIVSPADN